jgi:5'-methylthioadenosine phosphorylase
MSGVDAVFVSRHGAGHARLAQEVNYRAIIATMKELNVDSIITTAAVGAISPNYNVGDFVVLANAGEPAQVRQNWVYAQGHFGVEPLYDGRLRTALLEAGREIGLAIHDGGAYALRPGPEFETAKEVQDLRILGYSVVGMTTVTEAKMARQLGIPLATVCLVTNAAQKAESHQVSDEEVQEMMRLRGEDFVRLLKKTVEKLAKS